MQNGIFMLAGRLQRQRQRGSCLQALASRALTPSCSPWLQMRFAVALEPLAALAGRCLERACPLGWASCWMQV